MERKSEKIVERGGATARENRTAGFKKGYSMYVVGYESMGCPLFIELMKIKKEKRRTHTGWAGILAFSMLR